MLNIINQIMDACIPKTGNPAGCNVKFPEEIRHDNLAASCGFSAEVAQPSLRAWPVGTCRCRASPPPRVADGAEPAP